MEKKRFNPLYALGIPILTAAALAIVLGNSNKPPTQPRRQITQLANQTPKRKARTLEEHTVQKPTTLQIQRRQESSTQITQHNSPNPEYHWNDNFAHDSETMLLARALFGEARGEIHNSPDYVYGVARSIITRAKKRDLKLREVLLMKRKNTYQYTCFDKDNPNKAIRENFLTLKDPINYPKIKSKNPKNREEILKQREEVWRSCYDLAVEAINGNLKGRQELNDVTNYYVGLEAVSKKYSTLKEIRKAGIPSWAFEMKGGYFKRDKKGYFIPRKPKAVTRVGLTKRNPKIKAFFYNFYNF